MKKGLLSLSLEAVEKTVKQGTTVRRFRLTIRNVSVPQRVLDFRDDHRPDLQDSAACRKLLT